MDIFPVTVNNHTSFGKQLTFVRESSVILQKKGLFSVVEVTWSPWIMLVMTFRNVHLLGFYQYQAKVGQRIVRLEYVLGCLCLASRLWHSARCLLRKWSFFVTLRQTGIFRHSQVVPTELLMFRFLPDLRLNFWINWCLLGFVKHIKLRIHFFSIRPPQQDPRRSYQPFTLNIVKMLIYDGSKSKSIAYRRREGLPVNHHKYLGTILP